MTDPPQTSYSPVPPPRRCLEAQRTAAGSPARIRTSICVSPTQRANQAARVKIEIVSGGAPGGRKELAQI